MKEARCVLFGIFVVSLAAVSTAQEIVAVTEQWPPYNFEENGETKGVSTEIIKATLDRANLKSDFQVHTWARSYKMASGEKNENVLIYTILRNEERENLFKWVGPILPLAKMCLFKLAKRKDVAVNTLEDAKKYKVGVAINTSTHQLLRDKGFEEGKNLFPVPRQKQNIEKLFKAEGRLDLITDREITLAVQMRALGKPLKDVEKVFVLGEWDEGFYMAFGLKTADELVERVRSAFEEIKSEGIPDKMMEKYLKMYQMEIDHP